MSFLSVRQLTKAWRDTRASAQSDNPFVKAVDDISFDVAEGEFIALLGPSGCGKSTTLKMLAGLETPTAGQILLNGRDITHLPPGKRRLSMVFQSYALFPHLSVKDNILFGLQARKVARQEQHKRLMEVLELVDLQEQVHKKPGQLSGGQCQRVALARAIVSQAPLCLMDEPLSNLDARLRNEMRCEIRALQKKLGLTVIYVTHDQIEAMSMADRIVLLNQGRIEQMGAPHQLYTQPETTFAASFIGHPPMNLLTLQQDVLGIRPEQIRVLGATDNGVPPEDCLSSADHSTATSLPVDQVAETSLTSDLIQHTLPVINCDYHGADTQICLDFNGQMLKLSLAGHHVLSPGHRLTVGWKAEHEHRFSSKTGQRLATSSVPRHSLSKETKKDTSHVA